MLRPGLWIVAFTACACSSSGSTGTAPADAGANADAEVDAGPKSPTPGLIVFGSTTITFNNTCDTMRMAKNAIQALANKPQGISILMTSKEACDPRTAPDFCRITSDQTKIAPFFSMIDEIGTVKFRPVTDDLSPYDVVIAEYCLGYLKGQETILQEYIRTRGGVLVLADNFCVHPPDKTSGEANVLVSRYGVTLSTTEDPTPTECASVPAEQQIDLMEGVGAVNVRRWVPMTVASPARGYFVNGAGKTLAAVYERTLP